MRGALRICGSRRRRNEKPPRINELRDAENQLIDCGAHGRRNDSNGMGRSCVCLFWLRRSPSRGENAEAASGQSIGHVALETCGARSRRVAGTALDHAKGLI
jgi:hypothetical protein